MRRRLLLLLLLSSSLGACGSLEKLSRVGKVPEMSAITDPTKDPRWRPVSMPMPNPKDPPVVGASLWRAGSCTFLRDQRTSQVGDVITILVAMQDQAQLNNRTQRSRAGAEAMGMPNMFGLNSSMTRIFPNSIDPSNLVNTTQTGSSDGYGQMARNETVTLRVAATVTQLLPNGNMVVSGKQETRVDAEMRELSVQGIVRPQDIASDNTVQHDRLAEARIAYGGRGTLSDLQQPRYGQQLLDILLPF